MIRGNPLESIIFLSIAAYLAYTWHADYRQQAQGKNIDNAWPGATPCSLKLVILGCIGALVLVALETAGEYGLGISEEQDKLHAYFLINMLAAAIVEEMVFRGYLCVSHRGRLRLIMSVFVFSLMFACLHPYLWNVSFEGTSYWTFWEAEWNWNFSSKGIFSTALVFVNSIWFYTLRFMPMNHHQSLIPCFAAHAASNLAVFMVKAAQGHIVFKALTE